MKQNILNYIIWQKYQSHFYLLSTVFFTNKLTPHIEVRVTTNFHRDNLSNRHCDRNISSEVSSVSGPKKETTASAFYWEQSSKNVGKSTLAVILKT